MSSSTTNLKNRPWFYLLQHQALLETLVPNVQTNTALLTQVQDQIQQLFNSTNQINQQLQQEGAKVVYDYEQSTYTQPRYIKVVNAYKADAVFNNFSNTYTKPEFVINNESKRAYVADKADKVKYQDAYVSVDQVVKNIAVNQTVGFATNAATANKADLLRQADGTYKALDQSTVGEAQHAQRATLADNADLVWDNINKQYRYASDVAINYASVAKTTELLEYNGSKIPAADFQQIVADHAVQQLQNTFYSKQEVDDQLLNYAPLPNDYVTHPELDPINESIQHNRSLIDNNSGQIVHTNQQLIDLQQKVDLNQDTNTDKIKDNYGLIQNHYAQAKQLAVTFGQRAANIESEVDENKAALDDIKQQIADAKNKLQQLEQDLNIKSSIPSTNGKYHLIQSDGQGNIRTYPIKYSATIDILWDVNRPLLTTFRFNELISNYNFQGLPLGNFDLDVMIDKYDYVEINITYRFKKFNTSAMMHAYNNVLSNINFTLTRWELGNIWSLLPGNIGIDQEAPNPFIYLRQVYFHGLEGHTSTGPGFSVYHTYGFLVYYNKKLYFLPHNASFINTMIQFEKSLVEGIKIE